MVKIINSLRPHMSKYRSHIYVMQLNVKSGCSILGNSTAAIVVLVSFNNSIKTQEPLVAPFNLGLFFHHLAILDYRLGSESY